MYNVAFLFKQHLTDKISFFFLIIQQNMIIKKHFKDKYFHLWSFVFFSFRLDRDIHIGNTAGNGSDTNEKLNTNGTNSSNSSASGKKKKCKRRHR